MKRLLLIIACLITITANGQTPIAPTSGDGTIANPYQITTIQNLYWITESSSRWSYHYIQTENIDASETANWFSDGAGGYYGWQPIGKDYVGDFTGTYDGSGFSIYGMYINRTSEDYQGLFGRTNGATISNLGLENVEIHGRHYTGGLVGYSFNNTTVNNCYSIGDVTGSWHVGGLVADNYSSTVSNCYTEGSVAGSPMIGGLVGSSQYSASVSNSYSRCSVTGGLYEIGGLVGGLFYSSTISNSYSTGTVTGPNFYLGGLIGRNYSSPAASNSFWDVQTSGMLVSAGGTGKTTAEMKTQTTFTNAGWDFTAIWGMNTYENDGYPYLGWQDFAPQSYAPSRGDGTIGNPYQIANLGNLYWIAVEPLSWNKHFIQIANIDASETAYWFSNGSGGYLGWAAIGDFGNRFSGNYNGGGYIIDGLNINRGSSYQGLFCATSGATIANLGLINIHINAASAVGSLAGEISDNSNIINCFSEGTLTVSGVSGGLIGYCRNSNITRCYSAGSLTGVQDIGGLVGIIESSSTITDCYSRCNVTGSWYEVGGLVGGMFYSCTVINCYSTGIVVSPSFDVGGLIGRNYNCPPAQNCFWDLESSGKNISAGGTGKTTAEMKTNLTFLDAGWNPQVWNIGDGINDGYAYLAWQNPNGTSIFQAPLLSLPLNNSTAVSLNPTLSWYRVPGAVNYRLEVNTQDDFTGTIIFDTDTLTDTTLTIEELLNNSTYYWRVRAFNNFGFSSDTSDAFSFTTKLLSALLITPANNSVGINLSPALSWSTIPGADNYRLEINTQPDFAGTIVFDSDTISTIFCEAGGLTGNTIYYWRVTGLNNTGNVSDTSSTFSFTTFQSALVEAIFTITDGAGGTTTLIAGLDSLATDGLDPVYGEAQLTPVPPAGVFDARFNFPDSLISSSKDIRQGTFQEGFNRIHKMQFQVGTGTSIIIDYDFGNFTSDKVRGRLQDIVTGSLIDTTISGAGSYTVSDPTLYNKLRLTIIYDTSIPVELTSFLASRIDSDVNLLWTTATETNNSGFLIERKSKNENNWSAVTFVNGRGTTTEVTSYTYTDKNVPAGIYNYRLKQIDFDGSYEYSNIIEVEINAPKDFVLAQNYPNPFNPSTMINFEIPVQTNVLLKVYDLLGNEITTLVNEEKLAGSYKVGFDALSLSNGVYFYRLQAGNFVQTRKMILLK